MALTHVNPRAADVGENIYRQLKARLGEAWEQLSGEDVELLQQCSADAGVLQVAALVAPQTPEAQDKLLREKVQIHAQLMNLSSVGALEASAAFWDVVKLIVQGGVAVAFAAI